MIPQQMSFVLTSLLHFNELVFKSVFHLYDGKTTGPKTTQGPIGDYIKDIKSSDPTPIVNFKPIKGLDFSIDPELLVNNDQKYFHQICELVKNGPEYLSQLGLDFETKKPGNISNARWLTTASSILYMYCRTESPSEKLYRLAYVIINCYAPLFFQIKRDYQIQNGAKHYFSAVSLARKHMIQEEWNVVTTTFKTNAYMATSEYILLAGIVDDDPNIRKRAADLIIKARKKHSTGIRKYELPKTLLKLDTANHYFELLDFNKLPKKFFTPPPLLQVYSNDLILEAGNGEIDLDIPNIPCHSQNCERAVASTTFASQKEIGQENRHAFLLNLEKNRQLIKTHATKEEYLDLI